MELCEIMYTTNNKNKIIMTNCVMLLKKYIPFVLSRISIVLFYKPGFTKEYITFEDDGDFNMPVITLEVLANTDSQELVNSEPTEELQEAGIHFLTDAQKEELLNGKEKEDTPKDNKVINDFLEYMTRNDGSVVCKLCGEILQSRTHWYRHKYKLHVIQPLNPAPLFQCEQCLVYFKSRKGYIGHIASRHSDVLSDSSPVISNSQICPKEGPEPPELKEEPDPELSIPKSSVLNYQNSKQNAVKTEPKKEKQFRQRAESGDKSDWDKRRSREEKLVADIIDRVRKECEAQGSGGAARRGYTRRTTVMHT